MRKVLILALILSLTVIVLSCKKETPVQTITKEDKEDVSKEPAGRRHKFIQTFNIFHGPHPNFTKEDIEKISKLDLLMVSRGVNDNYGDNTFAVLKKMNPQILIFVYMQGVDIWRTWDKEGKYDLDKDPISHLNNVSRYNNARGHSMGDLNNDNPDLFLLDKNGKRCNTYMDGWVDKRFLMDFGSEKWVQYWLEAVNNDIIEQPWKGDGIFMDNVGPLLTFPSETPAKYDTPDKWAEADIRYVNAVTKALHEKGQKVWINAGGTAGVKGQEVLMALDNSTFPPDLVMEEFVFAYGNTKGMTRFPSEEKWKRSLDFLSMMKNSGQTYTSHTGIEEDGHGIDNWGAPVTFWQSLWYALCSYCLGKEDTLNPYFTFYGRGTKVWYFDEYDHIDLGKAVGKYKVTTLNGNNIYWREFEKGYVYLNPTENDVSGINLPQVCRQLDHYNLKNDPLTIPNIKTIDLRSHHATIFLKSSGKAEAYNKTEMPSPTVISAEKMAGLYSGEKVVFEAEDLAVHNAEIIGWKGSDNGIGVRFNSAQSLIQARVPLKRGTYDIVLFARARDEEHNTFFLSVDRSGKSISPSHIDKNAPTEGMRIYITQNKEYTLRVFPDETGMIIDRIEIMKPQYIGAPRILEAERFTLHNARARELKDASSGKGVLLNNEQSLMETKLLMKKGLYDIYVFVKAPDRAHDAFYITFDDNKKRLFPDGYNKIMKTRELRVDIPEDKECTIKVFPAETGMTIDRVEINMIKHAQKRPDRSKFIQTFLKYYNLKIKFEPGDESVLAKYDLLDIDRSRYDQINNDTWGVIKAINPDIEIYLYVQGVVIHKSWDAEGKYSLDEEDTVYLNNIARFNNARGHSMGSLNGDNPELFLLDKSGQRLHPSEKANSFIMDFGNKKFQKYWVKALKADIIDQPWAADGVYIDECGPRLNIGPQGIPAKYDTDEKWANAMNSFVNAVTKGLHEAGQKVCTNSGGTGEEFASKVHIKLDGMSNPPDVTKEEGAFAHGWSAETSFLREDIWKNQVDFAGKLKKTRLVFESHTKLSQGETGTDDGGKPVTFWQTLWYSLSSYLICKNDELNNTYFFFRGGSYTGGEDGSVKFPWFDEYDHIDLGKAVDKYKIAKIDDHNIYWREFEQGYVYVNPTENDVVSIQLPKTCKQLNHDNFKDDPFTIADVDTIDLKSHHGTILLKSK